MTINFSVFDNFFTLTQEQKDKNLFNWGQENLLPLKGKALEKAAYDLIMYFRKHPHAEQCPNLIVPKHYWGTNHEVTHNQLNYCLKDLILNILVYKHCDYIYFNEQGSILVIPDNKSPRFIDKDLADKRGNPNKVLLDSHFTISQKDTLWNGIVTGYLDVPEIISEKKEKAPAKKTAKKKATEEPESAVPKKTSKSKKIK